MAKKKIGFIGLGAMGNHMAKNLIKAGYDLTVHDLNPQAVKAIVSCGAKEAKSCAEVGKGVEVVLTMLPADDEVKAVCLGQGGVLEGAKPGTVIIDMSSIAPHTSQLVATEARKKGIKFLDAPVSGGTVGAEKATLTIMVGGDKALLDEHMEILQVMGKTIYHVGDVGMGVTVKMVNQMLLGINLAGIAEALVMGTKLGVAPEILYKVIRASSGNSFLFDHRVPNYIFTGNFTQPGFALDLLRKDLGIALESAKANKVPLFLTGQAYQYYTRAAAEGLGKKDMSAIIELLEKTVGVEVRKGKVLN
ncbi:MAG: NAD(P)-dependent oxidoreductase [Proteobacteria bacterium]|nr:NAD(P)-dependent oxidoreductase [Pseudomonadota bacterium]